MRRVTIKDIARIAGVSVTTVSRALNDAPEISPETRDRILQLCREEGYRTNLLARSLISNRTNVIGVILSDIVPGCFHHILFDYVEKREERVMLSQTIDKINHKYGLRSVGLAVAGDQNAQWKTKKEHLTPNYFTDIDQILTVQI